MLPWVEAIGEKPDRESAREKFHDFGKMLEATNDNVTFEGRQNDVLTVHVHYPDSGFRVRDWASHYDEHPVCVQDIQPVDSETIAVKWLLGELDSN